ncbi:MFS transporter [Gordonia rhizosphera]|uniref:Putative major facilitator superfamily transporter n=1 Tax=Gordonia rhizosphera NBRC 16068 TaxID=1108045 RepID=K6X2E9_9ACTN|nr:MFS transporter [Gordonia rhizosphera]GAB92974.1 putative major facilitator superfamily transporter [Gordonia rhizosphera NBRC 16068]
MVATPTVSAARRWSILGCSLMAALATASIAGGVAFLIPELQSSAGMSLPQASTLAAAAGVGLLLTTVPWGWALDRRGEREILLISLSATVVVTGAAVAAAATHQAFWIIGLLLLLAGAVSASTNGASGRIVVGWFPPDQRGTAMGIRQMAQPLGIGVCALTVPVLAEQFGVAAGLSVFLVVAVVALLGTVVGIIDPPVHAPVRKPDGSPAVAENPYRRSSYLIRIHLVSVLLVIPQLMLWTFVPVWLIDDRGWAAATAGVLVTVTQILGALGRIGAGRWSDVWGSRMRPVQVIAIVGAILMAGLAVTDRIGSPVAVIFMVAASIVAVADNGLAFTAIAEYAGPRWSGRGLAIQNTGQYLIASLSIPAIGAIIAAAGYPAAFGLVALAPLLAIGIVPVALEVRDDAND